MNQNYSAMLTASHIKYLCDKQYTYLGSSEGSKWVRSLFYLYEPNNYKTVSFSLFMSTGTANRIQKHILRVYRHFSRFSSSFSCLNCVVLCFCILSMWEPYGWKIWRVCVRAACVCVCIWQQRYFIEIIISNFQYDFVKRGREARKKKENQRKEIPFLSFSLGLSAVQLVYGNFLRIKNFVMRKLFFSFSSSSWRSVRPKSRMRTVKVLSLF